MISAWLRDEDHEAVRRASQRVNAITGLTTDTAEELQVVNYGIGGHYEPHFDFATVCSYYFLNALIFMFT